MLDKKKIEEEIKENLEREVTIENRIRKLIYAIIITLAVSILFLVFVDNKVFAYISLIASILEIIAAIINYASKNEKQ